MKRITHRKKRILFISLCCLLFLPISFNLNGATADQENQTREQRIEELKLKYNALEKKIKKNKRTVKHSMRKMQKQKQAMQFRGFFSAGVATTDGKSALRKLNDNQEIGDEPNFQSDSIVGLQLDAKINDKTRYTHQMTTAGFDIDHTVKTEWAYFSYKPFADTTIRVGRLRIPFFLMSESLDVGFTYPWVRLPIAIYTLPMSGYEGLDVVQQFALGPGFARTTLFFGSGLSTLSALLNANFKMSDLRGFSFDYNLNNWFLHFSYTAGNGSFVGNVSCDEDSVLLAIGLVIAGGTFDQSSVDCGGIDTLTFAFSTVDSFIASPELHISGLQNPEDWSFTYLDFALRYDNGSSLFIAEYGEVEFSNWFNPLGPSGYMLYGYRFGSWMPYVSIGSLVTGRPTKNLVDTMAERVAASALGDTAANSLRQLFVDAGTIISSQSYTVGVNYWINTNLRAKFEVAHYGHHKGTNGFFLTNPGSHNAVYSFAVDGVF
ncbi:MAG: hypothetical protein JKY67_12535 [Pseudomonadales bacterium]|nr:hypothetical protein [Pseudomonadales bacterium]